MKKITMSVLAAVICFAVCGKTVTEAEKVAQMRRYTMPSKVLVSALMQVESDRGATSKNVLQLKRIYIRDEYM